jgi:hypothetical protein
MALHEHGPADVALQERTKRRSPSADWAVFCSASKGATSKPTNSLSLPDTTGHAGPAGEDIDD